MPRLKNIDWKSLFSLHPADLDKVKSDLGILIGITLVVAGLYITMIIPLFISLITYPCIWLLGGSPFIVLLFVIASIWISAGALLLLYSLLFIRFYRGRRDDE